MPVNPPSPHASDYDYSGESGEDDSVLNQYQQSDSFYPSSHSSDDSMASPSALLRDLQSPDLIPKPSQPLPSVNGFLVYRGIDWYIRDTNSAVQFTNSCPVDYMITFLMIKGHTSAEFKGLVNLIEDDRIREIFTKIIILGGFRDTTRNGLAARDNELKSLWATLMFGDNWKNELTKKTNRGKFVYDMTSSAEHSIFVPLRPISSIYIHHSCSCNSGNTSPMPVESLENITPANLLSFGTFKPLITKGTGQCNNCNDPLNFERISVNRNNLFVFIETPEDATFKKYNEWPIEISLTDYESYSSGAPFMVQYELAVLSYNQRYTGSITHALAIIRLNNGYYFYDDTLYGGRLKIPTSTYELDNLLIDHHITHLIYVRK